MKKINFYSFVLVVLCFVCGCGYTTKANLAPHLKTIYIKALKNSIDFQTQGRRNVYLPLLEVDARDAIVDRFMMDGNLRITDEDESDLILSGELKRYNREVLRSDDDDDVEEYRVRVTVSLKMYDIKNDEAMWSEPNFSGEATYFVTGAQATTEASAIEEALEDLATRIVERTMDNW